MYVHWGSMLRNFLLIRVQDQNCLETTALKYKPTSWYWTN